MGQKDVLICYKSAYLAGCALFFRLQGCIFAELFGEILVPTIDL